jgi:hypothetical protein
LYSEGDRIRTDGLRPADWFGSSISTATTAAARRLEFWREKHNMPNVQSMLVGDRFASTNVSCRRGLDEGQEENNGEVQRDRRGQLRDCA